MYINKIFVVKYSSLFKKILFLFLLFYFILNTDYYEKLSQRVNDYLTRKGLIAKIIDEPIKSINSNYYNFNLIKVFPKKDELEQSQKIKNTSSRYGALENIDGALYYINGDGFSYIVNDNSVREGPKLSVLNNKSKFLNFIKKEHLGEYYGIKDALIIPNRKNSFKIIISTNEFDYSRNCHFLSVYKNEIIKKENEYILNKEWNKVYSTNPCLNKHKNGDFLGQSSGGRLVKDDSNNIYLSVGDFYFDGVNDENILQSNGSDYGKILQFRNGNKYPTIIAQGLRNPQGLFHYKGILYESEHGPQGGDELNLINIQMKKIDYGWPRATFGVNYGKNEWPLDPQNTNHYIYNFQLPIFSWIPSIGVSNLIVIEKNTKLIRWNHNLLVASLRDQSLYRIVLNKNNSIILVERIFIGIRIRDLIQIEDKIYILEDSISPRIYKVNLARIDSLNSIAI